MSSSDAVDDSEQAPKPLTRQEAEALRATVRLISPWRVVAWQVGVGLLVFAVVSVVSGWRGLMASVAYGSLVAVFPNAILAWGMTRSAKLNANALAFNFMFWEFLKIGVAVVLMVAAPLVVSGLSWVAMLVALILGMKANWLALFTQGGNKLIRS